VSAIIDRDLVVEKWLEDEFTPSADETNRMSNAGHPCDRYLYLRRTDGEKAARPNEHLRAIFKRGRIAQKAIARQQIVDAEYELYGQEQAYTVKAGNETIWRGHIDGAIRDPRKGQAAPVHVWEAKMINTHTWNAINSLDDMLSSRKPWIRGYPAQTMLYMYAKGVAETGVLHLIDSETWLPKFIDVPLDYAYVQELLDRGSRLNAALAAGVAPEPIDWCETCERCPLLMVCLPDAMSKAPDLRLIESPEFSIVMESWWAARKAKSDAEATFKDLDKLVKHECLGKGEFVAGDFWISTKQRQVKAYEVKPRVDEILEVKRLTPAAAADTEVA
jgi:CRISPR/Cas system-associated exonuclease Cas4 (RecB family)